MEDIVTKYRKKKLKKNITIISLACLVAFSLNIIVMNTDIGKNLKTSIQESRNPSVNSKSDIFIEKDKELTSPIINIKASKNIYDVNSLGLSIVYDPENIKINKIFTELKGGKVTKTTEDEGFTTLSLSFDTPTKISKNEDFLNIILQKKDENKINHLNIINAYFKDKDGEFHYLETSGIDF